MGVCVFTEEVKEEKFLMVHYTYTSKENILTLDAICDAFNVSRSGYYRWLKAEEAKKISDEEKEKFRQEIMSYFRAIIQKLCYVPGKRTFKVFLYRDFNIKLSNRRCAQIMKEMNLVATLPHKDAYKGQATYNHVCASMQNHVDRDFKVAPRTVILTDITYLYYGPCQDNLFYLCVFKDAFTTEILGHAVSKKMTVDLIKTAYDKMMLNHKNEFPKDTKVYIHSDQGSQYLSTTFKEILSNDGFVQSCSRRGNSIDNSPVESFFNRFKTNVLNKLALVTNYDDAVTMVENYINAHNDYNYQYNLAGLTPTEFYYYCVTGIYSLKNYFGVEAEKLLTIEEALKAKAKRDEEKREENKKRRSSVKIERGSRVNPIVRAKKDKETVIRLINRLNTEKCTVEFELQKAQELLVDIEKAIKFIQESSVIVQQDLTDVLSWLEYPELQYVNRMNGLF